MAESYDEAVMQMGNCVAPAQAFAVIGPIWAAIQLATGRECIGLDRVLGDILWGALPPGILG